jgi:hypothetical protein
MATWDDVRRIALALPQTSVRERRDGTLHLVVADKLFVWERPLRKSDLAALGAQAPTGPILGVRTVDLEAKQALLADDPAVFFTIPHFDGYAGVLVRLEEIAVDELEQLTFDAWLARAPKRVAKAYLEGLGEIEH